MQKLILGSGSWGAAIAKLLSKVSTDSPITIWGRSLQNVKKFQEKKILNRPIAHEASSNVKLVNSLINFPKNQQELLLVYALPSSAVNLGISLAKSLELANTDLKISFLNASKGLEQKSGKNITQVWQENFPKHRIAVISGPNLAKEVFQDKLMQTVLASKEEKYLKTLVQIFSSEKLKVQTSSDLIGTEFFGAFKNIFSLGAGAWDALDLGNSGKGAFLSICFKELVSLIKILGGKEKSAYLASGFGDFFITCTSTLSRNYRTGYYFAQGKTLLEISREILKNQVSEGIQTSQITQRLIIQKLPKKEQLQFKTFDLINRIFSFDQKNPDFKRLLVQEFSYLLN